MKCIGIDVSKGSSTICFIDHLGEMHISPTEVKHQKKELELFINKIEERGEVKAILEATGHYHYPVVKFFLEKGIFISVVNALSIKKFNDISIRKGKTDKLDSIKIAQYGLFKWNSLLKQDNASMVFTELRSLSRQYFHYKKAIVKHKVNLSNILDRVMPGINEYLKNSKMHDFINKYWHYDNINKQSRSAFVSGYNKWAKRKGYHSSTVKAETIYNHARDSITTLDSNYTSTKLIVQESISSIKNVSISSNLILAQMHTLAQELPEYKMVLGMNGVGEKLSVLLISEIGDVRRIKSKKALIALAGIDAPPYQSGGFTGTKRKISKRGNKYLRMVGYEVMQSLKKNKYIDDEVYKFIIKKELEGKPKKQAKIAGLNKFLRIYYARVMKLY